MYNWKMTSAYAVALDIVGLPEEALSILKKMADDFGNCGWQEGDAFESLRDNNHRVADILGYEWDESNDQWTRRA